jgi:hypothetical protein
MSRSAMPLRSSGTRQSSFWLKGMCMTNRESAVASRLGGCVPMALATSALVAASATSAHAQDVPAEERATPAQIQVIALVADTDATSDEEAAPYGKQGTLELGGSVAIGWTSETFNLDVSPSVGYFVVDRVELSTLLRISYASQEDDTGERTSLKGGALVFEPSYHLPLGEELFLLSGLGVGVGHDGDNFDFEIIPRLGLNIGVGLVGVLTPALRVPVAIDADGTTVGMGFEIGYSVTM